MGAKRWANVRALRVVLVLVGVNIHESRLNDAASALHCNVGKIHFLYLGLHIGGDPRRLIFWEPVLTHIKNRLSGWKRHFLSFGGRLILLKFVLTYLPVYALSFFKAPSGCWQLLMGWRVAGWEREGIIMVEGDFEIRDGVGGLGSGWFRESVLKSVGNGVKTFFWTDPWLGGRPLYERFGLLFDLAENKSCSVAKMFSLGWEVGEAWVWRRQLWVWEEMLRECQTLLFNFSFKVQSSDSWQWQPNLDIGYSVCGAYQLLTSHDSITLDEAKTFIWHNEIGCQRRLIWYLEASSLQKLISVYLGVEALNRLNIFFSHVGLLPPYGRRFHSGLVFLRWIIKSTLSFSPFCWRIVDRRARRSFMQLIWLLVCGFCGMRETIGFSGIQHKRYLKCWIKSKCTLFGC
ncbi:hypothetical protein TSUD_375140 [Trifolium subterraneum]|uniref:Reverse transcriptase zinc-binding domain-containing protein n=1 Tax=Trifolium subterraneum TaxID=3900 RepID=A0A2Z6MS30_TRISU|nr:hypothetical protein TSUD_375140 [Trifolium subterraneum]